MLLTPRARCKRCLVLVLLAFVVTVAPRASAQKQEKDDEKERCFDSYEDVQRERRAGHFVRAHELVQACVEPVCPALLRTDCESWKRELEQTIPTFVLEISGASGEQATVTVDGAAFVPRRPTVPQRIDPGEHRVHVEAGGRSADTTFVIASGERALRVQVRLSVPSEPTSPARSDAPAVPEERQSPGYPFFIAGGLSVAALGVFSVAAVVGRSRHAALEDDCGTRCAPSDVAEVSRLYFVADIALVAGLLSGGVATWLLLTRPSAAPSRGR